MKQSVKSRQSQLFDRFRWLDEQFSSHSGSVDFYDRRDTVHDLLLRDWHLDRLTRIDNLMARVRLAMMATEG